MSNVQKVSVALTSEFIALLKEAVETGEYTSTSEVVRDALREWKLRRSWDKIDAEDLRRLWHEGTRQRPGKRCRTGLCPFARQIRRSNVASANEPAGDFATCRRRSRRDQDNIARRTLRRQCG